MEERQRRKDASTPASRADAPLNCRDRQLRHTGWFKPVVTVIAVIVVMLQGLGQAATVIGGTTPNYIDDQTKVDKDNFLQYFGVHGDASYDQNSGTVTLTPDENNKVGNFSLNSKIDLSQSFTLQGQINLGDKTSDQMGADGIGFAFHQGNTNDVGNAGGNLGIGGLDNAVGFKLDTWHNDYSAPKNSANQIDPSDSDGFGWDTDPSGGDYPQFGAFVTTSLRNDIKGPEDQPVTRWWAVTDQNSAKRIDPVANNAFHDFKIQYDGAKRVLHVSYTEANGQVDEWEHTIPDSYQTASMFVSASTGAAKNLQQFKLDKFLFTQAASVDVKYVNTKNEDLKSLYTGSATDAEPSYDPNATAGATYLTNKLDIPGYHFLKMDYDGSVTGTKSLDPTGTLTPGPNGTVVYVYDKNTTITGEKSWQDNNDLYHTRPDKVTFKLSQNGNPYKTAEASAATNWQYTFTDLPATDDNGQPYDYKVSEDSVANYQSKQDGYNFTNTLTGTTTVSGQKTWDDGDNADHIRPDDITVNLLADNKQVKTQTITAANDWRYEFKDLPKYDAAGKKIAYTVEEAEVSGYTPTYDKPNDGNGKTVINITNKHKLKPTMKLRIKKQDENHNLLSGATFGLAGDAKEQLITTDQATGDLFKSALKANQHYVISEVTPPKGYEINPAQVEIAMDDTGTKPAIKIGDSTLKPGATVNGYTLAQNGDTITLTVTDHATPILPHTGGSGYQQLLVIALSMLGIAACLILIVMRKRREVSGRD
ncbi:lectin-like domain-containing protein [Lacticaseibacillus jixiensis]|uniref:lectin-like domain-containing protein n=1 Tax=Lacticaseibacillus jixiensis TaxID=3231926 RepID=UPI0036F43188